MSDAAAQRRYRAHRRGDHRMCSAEPRKTGWVGVGRPVTACPLAGLLVVPLGVVIEMNRLPSLSVEVCRRPAVWRAPLPPWAPRPRRVPVLPSIPAPLHMDVAWIGARERAVEVAYGIRGEKPTRVAAVPAGGFGRRRSHPPRTDAERERERIRARERRQRKRMGLP